MKNRFSVHIFGCLVDIEYDLINKDKVRLACPLVKEINGQNWRIAFYCEYEKNKRGGSWKVINNLCFPVASYVVDDTIQNIKQELAIPVMEGWKDFVRNNEKVLYVAHSKYLKNELAKVNDSIVNREKEIIELNEQKNSLENQLRIVDYNERVS